MNWMETFNDEPQLPCEVLRKKYWTLVVCEDTNLRAMKFLTEKPEL